MNLNWQKSEHLTPARNLWRSFWSLKSSKFWKALNFNSNFSMIFRTKISQMFSSEKPWKNYCWNLTLFEILMHFKLQNDLQRFLAGVKCSDSCQLRFTYHINERFYQIMPIKSISLVQTFSPSRYMYVVIDCFWQILPEKSLIFWRTFALNFAKSPGGGPRLPKILKVFANPYKKFPAHNQSACKM